MKDEINRGYNDNDKHKSNVKILNWLVCKYYSLYRRGKFIFMGKEHDFFFHPDNVTYSNTRAIETPIAKDIVDKYRGKNILEVGNVLSHYFPVEHWIIDKYEIAPGVENIDIFDCKGGNFDLIVSVSTLEHIGMQDGAIDENKSIKAFYKLKSMLAKGGLLFITVPVGVHPVFDVQLNKEEGLKKYVYNYHGEQVLIGIYKRRR